MEASDEEYDRAVAFFESYLGEVDEVQLAISDEAWWFIDYGNRPQSCEHGPGAGFGTTRGTPFEGGGVPTDVEEVRARLAASGFEVGEVSARIPNELSFLVTGELGRWRVVLFEGRRWAVTGSSFCVDVDRKAVRRAMNLAGFDYLSNQELWLRPGERLPIGRGQTPAPMPTERPAP
ncbi:hypothetical protein USB125703_01032 [Pseudoclavibacter triregionum]|nr:hypothetical protein USB125703_01032 [Pseudoclavibacter triregionum]